MLLCGGGCSAKQSSVYELRESLYGIGTVVGKAYLNGSKFTGVFPTTQTNIPQHTEFVNIGTKGFYPSVGTERIEICYYSVVKDADERKHCNSYFYTYTKDILTDILGNGLATISNLGTNILTGTVFYSLNFDYERFDNFIKENDLQTWRIKLTEMADSAKIQKRRSEINTASKSGKNTKLKDFFIILDATTAINEKDVDGEIRFVKAKQGVYDLAYKLDNHKINLGLIICDEKCYIAVYPTSKFYLVSEYLDYVSVGGMANINDAFKLAKAKGNDSLFLLVANKSVNTSWLDKFKKSKINLYALNYGTKIDTNLNRYGYEMRSANSSIVLDDEIKKILEQTRVAKQNWSDGDYTFRVNFDFNNDKIKDEYMPTVAEFAKYLRSNFNSVLLQGHTDDVGSDEYNDALSLKRAKAIKNALVLQGIPKDRISVAGYGKNIPLVANSSEANRAINRRVEAKVGKDGYYDISVVNASNKKRVVSLDKARYENLSGYFLVTDKERSYAQYHAVFVLYPNNQVYYSEYIDGKSISFANKDAFWNFDNKSSEFLFDATNQGMYPKSGVLKGKIIGDTNSFNMNGKWSNGSVAKTKFYRISKDEFLCVMNGLSDCFR